MEWQARVGGFPNKSHDVAAPHAPARRDSVALVAMQERLLTPVDRAFSTGANEVNSLLSVKSAVNKRNGNKNWAAAKAGNAVHSQDCSLLPGPGSESPPLANHFSRGCFAVCKGELMQANACGQNRGVIVGRGAGSNQIGHSRLEHRGEIRLDIFICRGIKNEAFQIPRLDQRWHIQQHSNALLLLLVLLYPRSGVAPAPTADFVAASAVGAAVAATAAGSIKTAGTASVLVLQRELSTRRGKGAAAAATHSACVFRWSCSMSGKARKETVVAAATAVVAEATARRGEGPLVKRMRRGQQILL